MHKPARTRFGAMAIVALAAFICGTLPASAQSFTEWGWPQPYEKVSDKSIAWLKQKGWWPLGFGWQGPFSGQNTINVVMDKAELLEKRGLETKFQVFAAGPDVNEAVASARIHVGNGGNFPFTSLLDRGVPVRAIAVVAPNLKHSTVVPVDSPIKKLADFKGSNPPATIGIVTGSSAEFYFTQAAEVVGLQIGKDVILKNMPPSEQILMAKGIGAVVPWEPSVTIIEDRKTGREVDTIFPYNFYEGMFYVRQ
ncbi:MAG: ABC transporter substrate-binding protein [Pseudolabrys sp.]